MMATFPNGKYHNVIFLNYSVLPFTNLLFNIISTAEREDAKMLISSRTIRIIGAWLLFITAALAQTSRSLIIDFDNMEVDKTPVSFFSSLTGEGGPALWVIEKQAGGKTGSNLLVQKSHEKTGYRFPLCIYDAYAGKDPELAVRFRPISGEVDQAAGLIWRYQDADNYYVVRANALENNVVLYKVKNGKRSDLKPAGAGKFAYGKNIPVPTGQWSTLGVKILNDKFSVYLNGKHLFDVEDGTFQQAGKVGLWTKADSVTEFDSFVIKDFIDD